MTKKDKEIIYKMDARINALQNDIQDLTELIFRIIDCKHYEIQEFYNRGIGSHTDYNRNFAKALGIKNPEEVEE